MWTKIISRHLAVCSLVVLFACAAESQTTQTPPRLSIPPDSPRWDLQGQAKPAEYQGRKSLLLDGGAAILKDFEMRDAIVDVDVATPASRGFFGIQFRLDKDGANGEWVYLRQHKSGYPDAMQYTPVLNTGANWQIYNGGGRAARVCGHLSLSRGSASEGLVCKRLFQAPGTPTRNEGRVCAYQHRFRPRPGEKALPRLKRRGQRVPEWQDSFPWSQRSEFS